MAERITRADVEHVAHLARLALSEEEIASLTDELGAIVDYAAQVSALDLHDVPPTAHPLELANAWAEDEPRPCLPLGDVFANAPAREGDYFKVPPGGSS